ncbi:translocation protein TolB [Methyloprofundus sedimenti]|uniref:Tol-Pal system protein TolB n=1 Tax=Methyloprofundus sedimenti TaxID=1420851 RepID=A0A1V8MAV9_9GAMM|nr:Tol-Pal system beta propeller repeat protein TolB [Methyloprofundus sedimenti]OQK18731.1 translocation protein TolB [Methyloprofundus sedimenti]
MTALIYSHVLQAELTIEITEGVQSAYKIAVVPFAAPEGGALNTDVVQIISQDLAGSGYFKVLPRGEMLTYPTQPAQVKFRNWTAIGQDYLVIGAITKDNNLYHIEMSLFDIYKKEQLKGLRITVGASSLNMAAHHLSDVIYQQITGIAGVFSTRIAYITNQFDAQNKPQYKLQVADYDGKNAISIAQSKEPIMSPAWSPDGQKIAYVSFENKVSEIFVQTLKTGERKSVAKYKGINGSPAWSPDGKKLAITLSKDGNSDIYILTLADLSLIKLTRSLAIDTEASWSPDGKQILFTSDRGGLPQIYVMPSNGQGSAKRITFDGNYNARGAFSADGKKIVMVQGTQGKYRIALLNLTTGANTVLTEGPFDESPSFAPNGQMIIYARRKGNKEILSTITLDGLARKDIQAAYGKVREPAWAPRK